MDSTAQANPPVSPVETIPPGDRTDRADVPVLELVAVNVPALRNPDQIVLEAINWSVWAGEYWAIGGLHASGKSDLLAVAAGILPPAQGAVRIFGREPDAGFEQERIAARRRLGLVFAAGQLLQHLTVAENISLPLRYHRNCRLEQCAQRVQALLELTHLTDWAGAYPGTMTPTRLKRAGLARALALEPELLLLDSPLSGLDPHDAAWWLDLLSQLATGHPLVGGRSLTLVITTDDLRPWCDRARQFAVLKHKHLIALTDPARYGQNPDALLREMRDAESASF